MTNRLRRYDIIALLKQGKNLKVRVSHPSFGSELTLSYKGKRETVKKEKDLLVLQEGCLYMYRKQKESPYCAEFLADWKLNMASDTVLELNLEEEQYTLQVHPIAKLRPKIPKKHSCGRLLFCTKLMWRNGGLGQELLPMKFC